MIYMGPFPQVSGVGRPGIEPGTRGLKGTASAVHGSTREPLASGRSGGDVPGEARTSLWLRHLGYTGGYTPGAVDLPVPRPGQPRVIAIGKATGHAGADARIRTGNLPIASRCRSGA
jgi:hypothetical protein